MFSLFMNKKSWKYFLLVPEGCANYSVKMIMSFFNLESARVAKYRKNVIYYFRQMKYLFPPVEICLGAFLLIASLECWGNCGDDVKRNIILSIWESRKPMTITKHSLCLRKFLNYSCEVSFEVKLPISSLYIAQYLNHVRRQTKF